MLCVDNYAANVAAGTLYTLLVGQTAWLQRQYGLPDRIQSLESRPHRGGGRVSLDSGADSGEEGLPPLLSSVGRALVRSGVSASNTGDQDVGRVTRVATPGVRRGRRRSGSRRVVVAYQDADRDPSSTAMSNRLSVGMSVPCRHLSRRIINASVKGTINY